MEAPKFGTGFFSVAAEKHGVLAGEDGDGCFVEEDAAVMVTEWADAHQIVMKVGHDVAGGGRKLRQQDVTRGG